MARLQLSGEVDRGWMVMDERLLEVYTSVLAGDFAAANRLQATTDQVSAFVIPGRPDL